VDIGVLILMHLLLFLFQRTILMKLLYYDDVTVRSFKCFRVLLNVSIELSFTYL
jgi:hypothetical protein